MGNQQTARDLGTSHCFLTLKKSDDGWVSPSSGNATAVEFAAFDHYQNVGLRGFGKTNIEGGLVLNVLKAASFTTLDGGNKTTFIEALYSGNATFKEDLHKPERLIENVRNSTVEQIEKNARFMLSEKRVKYTRTGMDRPRDPKAIEAIRSVVKNYSPPSIEGVVGQFSSRGSITKHFTGLTLGLMVEFYERIGRHKLAEIATIFASDPYSFRKGWADLTMWDDTGVRFMEIKAPGDRLQASQLKLIKNLIVPLCLDYRIVDVQAD